jgi:RNA polymerase-binding transcription factor DksA
MNVETNRTYYDKLRQRRAQVETTLAHLKNERRGVEANIELMDASAYQHRITLLDRLTGWYHEETAAIEKAFDRVKQGRYGLCLKCHKPIEVERLELWLDAEFCFDCQER